MAFVNNFVINVAILHINVLVKFTMSHMG